nr:TNF receptor-associated factor 2-like isoform X2 [Pocillopora verrucosa]
MPGNVATITVRMVLISRSESSRSNDFCAEEMEHVDSRNGQANPVDDYQPLQLQELGTEEASSHSICNGGDENALPQWEQVELVDRMQRPEHQPFLWQECGIQVNVLSVPIQETELYRSQESGTCQTLDQGCAWNHPLQEMEQPALRRPCGTYGLLACHQPCDDGFVNVVSSLGRIQQPIEHCCGRQEIRLWQGQLDRIASQKSTRNKQNPRETYFIMKYTEVERFRQADDNGVAPAVFGPAIDSDIFEYKFGVRMYPNGVGDGRGRFVAIFVHMMEGEHDDFLSWPYAGRITLSVLDRNGQRDNDISHTLQAKPTLAAFQRPREAICPIGYGLIYFARIEVLFGPQFVKNDELFLKIEFSST